MSADEIINWTKRETESLKTHISNEEMQKWVKRCKNDVKLSNQCRKPIDGLTTEWLDDCELWLLETSKKEGVKFGLLDITQFRILLSQWVGQQFEEELDKRVNI